MSTANARQDRIRQVIIANRLKNVRYAAVTNLENSKHAVMLDRGDPAKGKAWLYVSPAMADLIENAENHDELVHVLRSIPVVIVRDWDPYGDIGPELDKARKRQFSAPQNVLQSLPNR